MNIEFAILLDSLKKINMVYWVCYNLKVINIYTCIFYQNQNFIKKKKKSFITYNMKVQHVYIYNLNQNQNFIKIIVRNLYILTQ